MSQKKQPEDKTSDRYGERFVQKGSGRQKSGDADVPPPRGLPGAVLSGIMDWVLAGWFVYALSETLRSAGPYASFMDFWQWWFAYEFFSWLGLFTVTMFSFRVYSQAEPDLKVNVWQKPSYWYGLGIMLLILFGLLGKASYDMFGDFWFLRYFLIIYTVRFICFSMSPTDKAIDKLIEQTLVFIIAMTLAFFFGMMVLGGFLTNIFIAAVPPELSGYDNLERYNQLTRCVYLLSFGTCYYLAMGILAYVLARYPRFTLAGLDSMDRRQNGTFRQ